MQFKLIKENEDGSADCTMVLSKEEQEDIIRSVIMKALIEAAKDGKKYDPGELSVGNATSGGEDSVHGSGEQSSQSGSTSYSTKAA